MSSKTTRLTPESIAAAALRIADAEGFAAVSMRRVAQDLGVGTMSLYHYVATKDQLIAAMDDALMGEALLVSVPRAWREAITAIAHQTHEMFLRHPWALASMTSAPPGVNAMRHMEQCLQALSKTKMTDGQKLTLLAIVDDLVFGHALREAARDAVIDLDFAKSQLATGHFPATAAVFRNGRIEARKDRFKLSLDRILEGERAH